jgi:hypothetical protein
MSVERRWPPLQKPAPTPTAVELVRSKGDADAHAALAKLRELVVGPTQQLNEARLEEMIKIFEEREAEMRALLRDIQKRNSELEIALKQNFIEQLNNFKSEFLSLTDGLMIENKKTSAAMRDELAAARKETLDLVHDSMTVAEQKLMVQASRLESIVKSEASKLQTEVKLVDDNLRAAQVAAQTDTHNSICRVLKEAADNLSRAVAKE